MTDETQKAVASWLKILEGAKSNASLTGLTAEFETLAKFINQRSPAVAVEILNVGQQFSKTDTAQPLDPGPASKEPMVRLPRVVWKIHEKDGRKHRWSCKWQGMDLRVDHARDIAGKVVFNGSINGERVVSSKVLAQSQSAVAAQALIRAQAAKR